MRNLLLVNMDDANADDDDAVADAGANADDDCDCSEVVCSDEFLSLTVDQVTKLIADDQLVVSSEEQVISLSFCLSVCHFILSHFPNLKYTGWPKKRGHPTFSRKSRKLPKIIT